jgi:hypothetical protein
MLDRKSLATGVLALLVAMSYVIVEAQGQGGGAPQGQGGATPQGGQGAGAPQGRGAQPGAPAGGAQGRGAGAGAGRGGRGAAYTPPQGSKELKDVLYNWTWHMGMLRSGAESELIKTLDYYGASGSVQVNGQPCTLTKYHLQANYQIPGYRIEIACTRPNKQTYNVVENMSGDYAWDDDIPGAELVAGKGKSTPNQGALTERRIRLWASPHGAPKAALAAAAGMHPLQSFGQNPATLLDRQAAAGVKGTTTLTWETEKVTEKVGGKAVEKTVEKAVLTFPVPDVPGATATATLVNYLPERVVVTNGTDKTEFVYGKWADFNNPLFKIEALMPTTTVERKNGVAVRNVTSKVTEIGQIYVIVPVPDSIQKAGK